MVYEGDTEKEFYPRVIQEIKKELGFVRLPFSIYPINIKGIGKFKTKLLNKFKNEVFLKCQGEVIVVLCYDTDVFSFNPHPPLNWKKIEEQLKHMGANKVFHMQARTSIEEFFLQDLEGLCSYLKIDVPKHLNGNTSLDKIQELFKRADRFYMKGYRSSEFISYLDMTKIIQNKKNELQVLYNLFN